MRPTTFGLIIFLEIMLLDGIFAASTIKQRHHILPFEDYNQEDAMEIKIDYDEKTGRVHGREMADQQALGTLIGKTSLTPAELEEASIIFTQAKVTFNEEQP